MQRRPAPSLLPEAAGAAGPGGDTRSAGGAPPGAAPPAGPSAGGAEAAALLAAAQRGSADLCGRLLAAGAGAGAARLGAALQLACGKAVCDGVEAEGEHPGADYAAAVGLLLGAGADPNAAGARGVTPRPRWPPSRGGPRWWTPCWQQARTSTRRPPAAAARRRAPRRGGQGAGGDPGEAARRRRGCQPGNRV